MLLDEPTTGLDPELRQTFYDVIQRLAADGTTLSAQALVATLLLWTLVPLAFATLAFSRREL